ncbi:MAG: hypothetical protein VB959_19745, partial [Rhodospirillales bacterium]
HGGFANWIEANSPRNKDEWVKLFRQNFKFAGGEIVGEFLMSIGTLPGAPAKLPDLCEYRRAQSSLAQPIGRR